MPHRTPQFTRAEKVAVLTEALRLLRKPESWVKGSWKCLVTTARWDDHEYNSEAEPVLDSRGRPQFAYCLEGAINQAVVNVLGEKRAERLGAIGIETWHYEVKGQRYIESAVDGGAPTRLISITELLKAENMLDECQPANHFNDDGATTHADVIDVLKRRRNQLKKELGKK
jgi:hypothetical protein